MIHYNTLAVLRVYTWSWYLYLPILYALFLRSKSRVSSWIHNIVLCMLDSDCIAAVWYNNKYGHMSHIIISYIYIIHRMLRIWYRNLLPASAPLRRRRRAAATALWMLYTTYTHTQGGRKNLWRILQLLYFLVGPFLAAADWIEFLYIM